MGAINTLCNLRDPCMNQLQEDLAPMGKKRAAVIIGRFSPPQRGHYALIDAVKKFIRIHKSLGLIATPIIVIIGGSKSDQDKKRNPLSVTDRHTFMKASGKTNGCLFFSAPNAMAAFSMLREKGYEPIAVAAGSDRIDSYKNILDQYFKDGGGKGIQHYTIKLARDENDKEDTTLEKLKTDDSVKTNQISGSLARRAVELGYEPEFAKIVGLDGKPELAKKMFDKIKASSND
jgi:hypothetical protein